MFDDNDYLKQKFQDFLKDEIDELKQHKLRFFALIVSLLLSIALIFTEDSGETIEVSNSSKIEENSDTSQKKDTEKDKKTPNKKVIYVKKDSDKTNGEKVVAVLGANSDELYIGDPFQFDEEKPAKIQQKTSENVVIPRQVPIIPPQLPPIPDQIQNLPPIPVASPQITEQMSEPTKLPEKEFVLTGTAINLDKKSAVVQKISTVQGKNVREENLIVSVGDSLEGHQIVDITAGAVVFDDGHRINSNYLGSNISIEIDDTDVEFSDIPVNYESIPDSALPIIPDAYSGNLSDENEFKIHDIAVEDAVPTVDNKNFIQIDDEKLDLNSGTTDKSTTFELDEPNIDFSVDNDGDTFANNSDTSVSVQDVLFISGDNSP